MNSIFTFIITLIYILYNIVTLSVLDKDQNVLIHMIVGGVIGFISLSALVYYYLKTQNNSLFLLLFGIILIIGYTFSLINIKKTIDDKDISENEINALKTKTMTSGILFTIVGFIAYILNSFMGDCQNINELLCDKNILFLLLLSNIVVYNSINFLKLHGRGWIWNKDDKDDKDNISMDLGVIIMLCLWQLYIYFLVDGFKGARLSDTSSIPQDKSITVLFSGLSVFVILSLLIYLFVTNAQCKKWENIKHINNIKEISYNMLTTSIISIIIIGSHVI